ncbi:MAG TPA: hypothetical protein VHW60_15960, partial [Caulobacteraceae bacterium]|nr:hypothetical protein [Caulobacteraceae bacterium]
MLRRTQLMVSCALGALLMSAGAATAQSVDQASPVSAAQTEAVTATADSTASDSTASGATNSQSSDTPQVGELMVTARLREENIQKVPQNVIAVSAQVLADNNVTNFYNLQGFAPSLDVATFLYRNY